MARDFGFSMIRAGPVGGGSTIKSACMLREGFKALSAKIDFPLEAMGLGGLEIELSVKNKSGQLGANAAYIPDYHSIVMGLLPMALAHEWIHALEEQIKTHGSKDQKER